MRATPFLMFQGQGRHALDLYRRAFPDFEEITLRLHDEGELAGQIVSARIRLAGLEIALFDSPPMHGFTFTPSSSIFIDCDDEAQLRLLTEILGEGGAVMMPIDAYGFSTLYTWLSDRFGVSWQINLP